MRKTATYFLCALFLCQVAEIFSQWDWNTGREINFLVEGGGNQNQQQQNNNNNNNNPPNYDNCFRICQLRVLKEFNPVCASNQVTYNNRRILGCAQRCGLQITEISQSTCEPSAG